ncbi:Formyltransferase [Stipitochalara longipes BDJ]|nr:Formyltransferase [Stipitochalara longipes BDJ]
MVSWLMLQCVAKIPRRPLLLQRIGRFYSTKSSKPLRILFCGSDDFSSASLRALHAECERNPQLIKSIDVLCRPGKPSGRSLKKIREVPIKAVAQQLSLPVHERDTFTGWDLPKPQGESINLIIAVSFGLFVPPRILRSTEYGGLNVHPSLLPLFRGPAPLQHTILSGTKQTGVTLQTLDDKSFDHGIILAQTPAPFFSVPSWEHCTYYELLQFLAPKAASMLVRGLQDRLFVPPLVDVGLSSMEDDDSSNPTGYRREHAGKITPEDRKINFLNWRGDRIYRHYRALGRLWTDVWIDAKTTKRLIFEDITLDDRPSIAWTENWEKTYPGADIRKAEEGVHSMTPLFIVASKVASFWYPVRYVADGSAIIFDTNSGSVRVGSITVEGQSKKAASKALGSLRPEISWRLVSGQKQTSEGAHKLFVEPVESDELKEEGNREVGGD